MFYILVECLSFIPSNQLIDTTNREHYAVPYLTTGTHTLIQKRLH